MARRAREYEAAGPNLGGGRRIEEIHRGSTGDIVEAMRGHNKPLYEDVRCPSSYRESETESKEVVQDQGVR